MHPIKMYGKNFRSKSKAGYFLVTEKKVDIREAAKKVGVNYMTLYQMFNKERIEAKRIPDRIQKWHSRGKDVQWIANKIGIDIKEVKKYI